MPIRLEREVPGLGDEVFTEAVVWFLRDACEAGSLVEVARGEQTPRTLILGDRRIAVADVLDAWLAPDYRYFKVRGADGDTYLVRHDERSNTWELTMFRAKHVGE